MTSTRPIPTPRKLQSVQADRPTPVPAPRLLLRVKTHSQHTSIFDIVVGQPEISCREDENGIVVNYEGDDDDVTSSEKRCDNTPSLQWEGDGESVIEENLSGTFSELSPAKGQELSDESDGSSETFTQEQSGLPPISISKEFPGDIPSKSCCSTVFEGATNENRSSSLGLHSKDDIDVHDFETVSFGQNEENFDPRTATEEGSLGTNDRLCSVTNLLDHSADRSVKNVVDKTALCPKRVRFLDVSSQYVRHNTPIEIQQMFDEGRDPLNGLLSLDTTVKMINERCKIIETLRAKIQENQTQIIKDVTSIRGHIDMSFHASLRNIRRARVRLLKKGILRQVDGNGRGKMVSHCSPRQFSFINSSAKEMVDPATGIVKIGRLGFNSSQQLETVLKMNYYDASGDKKLHFIEQYQWAVGSLVKHLKCVGAVGLSENYVLVVADQRDELGVCVGLWSKRTSRYRKWQVVVPLKSSPLHSAVTVSQTLGTNAQNEPVVVIAIGEILYLIRQSPLLVDKYTHENICNCSKLKLGSCVSSVACVVGKSNYIAITCRKKDLVYLFDTHGDQIVQQIAFTSGKMSLRLGFAVVRESRIKFGILLEKGDEDSFICMADSEGTIHKPMARLSVNWNTLIPFNLHYHVAGGAEECLATYRSEARKIFVIKFPYERSTREIKFITSIHHDKALVGLTTLQSTSHLSVAIAFEDGRLIVC